jgi:hypothetical protein
VDLIFGHPEDPAGKRVGAAGAASPVDSQYLAAASALKSKCPVTDGGSAVLIVPVEARRGYTANQSLSVALEQLGVGPVLTLQVSLTDNGATAAKESQSINSISGGNSDLSMRLVEKDTGTEATSTLARLDTSIPPAMIHSDKYGDMIRTLKTRFRFVLIETPPLAAAETLLLGQQSDGLVFLVHEGDTAMRELAAAKQIASRARLNVLGFFFEKRPRGRRRRRFGLL